MYVVIVYDVDQQRVAKVCQYLRRHLHWVQNSAFEGEITPARLEEIKVGLKNLLDLRYDSVYIYRAAAAKYLTRETIGVAKAPLDPILE